MACGLVLHTVIDGQHGFVASLEGLAVGLALFLVFYVTGGMGAGDVKLMAAVGSFVGPLDVFYAGLTTVLLGGIYAAITLVTQYGLRESVVRVWSLLVTFTLSSEVSVSRAGPHSQYQLRYAVVIGLGTMLSEMFLVP
jgi:prepilin peptidase CpaA